MATVDSVLAQYEKNKNATSSNANKMSSEDRLKRYFTTVLPKGVKSGEKRIRILPTLDGETPFKEGYFHEIQVDGNWVKLYDPAQEGKRSPLNEVKEALYATKVQSDAELARQYRSRLFYIVKVIDRDNEQDGPKFWRFKHNTKEYDNKITIHNGYSSYMLKQLGNEPLFDFAYIDASHTAYGTLEDAILVHPLIKNGGIIIFDDYKWKDPKRPSITDSPELGINCFANAYADFYGVLFVGYQIGLVKVGNIK